MNQVISKDGTLIAFDQSGTGPAVILVMGALGVRSDATDLAARLAPHLTVFNYDRRGRGESGDTPPYAVEREVEDIQAVIEAAGGSACLYGLSSGAVLALDAANRLPTQVKKLALYEPPLIVDDSHPPLPDDYVAQLQHALASGRRGDAVEILMTQAVGMPAQLVAEMRNMPMWSGMEQVAPTLVYDGIIVQDVMRGKPLPVKRWASLIAPTMVIVGGNSEPFFRTGAQALVDILPNAQRRVLEGQTHAADPAALAVVLVEFFTH